MPNTTTIYSSKDMNGLVRLHRHRYFCLGIAICLMEELTA